MKISSLHINAKKARVTGRCILPGSSTMLLLRKNEKIHQKSHLTDTENLLETETLEEYIKNAYF